jgi:exonuclease VII large subunit
MKTKIGNPYQEIVVSDDLKRLYLLGFFSDIKIDTEPYKDGIKVIASGRVSVFVKRGDYSVIVERMEPAGKGALLA